VVKVYRFFTIFVREERNPALNARLSLLETRNLEPETFYPCGISSIPQGEL